MAVVAATITFRRVKIKILLKHLIVDRFCYRPKYDCQMKIYSETKSTFETLYLKTSNQSNILISTGSRLLRCLNVRFWSHQGSFYWETHRFNNTEDSWSNCSVQWLFLPHWGAQVSFPNSVGPEQVIGPTLYFQVIKMCAWKNNWRHLLYISLHVWKGASYQPLSCVCVFFFLCWKDILFKWRSNDLINSTCNGLIHKFISYHKWSTKHIWFKLHLK